MLNNIVFKTKLWNQWLKNQFLYLTCLKLFWIPSCDDKQQFLTSVCTCIFDHLLAAQVVHVVIVMLFDPPYRPSICFKPLPFFISNPKKQFRSYKPTALVWPNYLYSVYAIRRCRPMFSKRTLQKQLGWYETMYTAIDVIMNQNQY